MTAIEPGAVLAPFTDEDGKPISLAEMAHLALDPYYAGLCPTPDIEAGMLLVGALVLGPHPNLISRESGMPFRCADALARQARRKRIWQPADDGSFTFAYEWLSYALDPEADAGLWGIGLMLQVCHLLGDLSGVVDDEGLWGYQAIPEPHRPLKAPLRDVIKGLAAGLTQAQIAARLGCSPFPVWCAING